MRIHARTLLTLAGCLAVLLLAMRYVNYRRQQRVETGKFAAHYETSVQKLRAETIALSRKLAQNGTYDPALIVAPVEPVIPVTKPGAAGANGEITLQGVSWSTEMPLALINDKLYKTGDRVAGGTIVKILPYSVILQTAAGAEKEIQLVKEKK
jgi:hypothetical protein